MVKSLNEHRKNIRPEVRATARTKAIGIVAEMSLSGAKKAKEKKQPTLAVKTGKTLNK